MAQPHDLSGPVQVAWWSVVLAASALTALALTATCIVWWEHREPREKRARPIWINVVVGISFLVAAIATGLITALAFACAARHILPTSKILRPILQLGGRLGFVVGFWAASILGQFTTNGLRLLAKVQVQPISWLKFSFAERKREEHEAAQAHVNPGERPWFAAMEYYALFLNRTYKVFIGTEMLCGAKVRGLVADSITVSQMYTQEYWVNTRSAARLANIDVQSSAFLAFDKANFKLHWDETLRVEYIPGRKWGMGRVPHSGRIVLHLSNGKQKELILLGNQDGVALKVVIDRLRAVA